MTQLTKTERHSIYMIMLAETELTIHRRKYLGFCCMFSKLVDIDLDDDRRYGNFKRYLPELFEKRRNRWVKKPFLWDTWEQRREDLKQCIRETY